MQKAPRLFPLLEIHPTSCNIMLTTKCNLKCVMCRQWREKPGDELSTDGWKRVIKELNRSGISNIHFTGGEPLLRGDLVDLISFSAGNGSAVGMTTNGILLNKDILEELIGAGLRSVGISIDALDAGYEKIRGVSGSFTKLREAVALISEVRKTKKLDAYINFTLIKDNIDDFMNVKKFADEIGLPIGVCLLDGSSSIFDLDENRKKYWIREDDDLTKLKSLSHFLDSELMRKPSTLTMNFQGIEFIKNYFKDPRQGHIPCVISQDRIFIDPYGNVFGGCLSMGSFGNIRETSFEELCGGGKYRDAKKKMFYKICPGCSCGYSFNLMHTPAFILKNMGDRIKRLAFAK